MRVFLDTNVILEFFLDREDGKTAGRLFTLLQEQKHSLYMTAGSFYTMIFHLRAVDRKSPAEIAVITDIFKLTQI